MDVREEEEDFQGLITACLSALILAVQTRLDSPLQQMCRMPWASMDVVRSHTQSSKEVIFSCLSVMHRWSSSSTESCEQIVLDLHLEVYPDFPSSRELNAPDTGFAMLL